ncbi:MAG: peptidase M15 [Bacteroidaceae bacterium]|nr:peptidase M15 [Bacteroidaceae bacterium]
MRYFTIQELTASQVAKRKGIDNTPDAKAKACLTALVSNLLDPLRERWGSPIVVNSGYRCAKLNRAVGGVTRSQHCKGQAADIRTMSNTRAGNMRLFEFIRTSGLPFDQLIDEHDYSWVHVSFVQGANRRQVLHVK